MQVLICYVCHLSLTVHCYIKHPKRSIFLCSGESQVNVSSIYVFVLYHFDMIYAAPKQCIHLFRSLHTLHRSKDSSRICNIGLPIHYMV